VLAIVVGAGIGAVTAALALQREGVDAVVLARSVAKQGDPSAALRDYEARRIARTAPLTRLPRRTPRCSTGAIRDA
jgi:thiazole synthase ThiGH ThiG subunit